MESSKVCLECVHILRKMLLMFTYWTSSKDSYIGKQVLFIGFVICRMHLAFYSLFRHILSFIFLLFCNYNSQLQDTIFVFTATILLQGLNKASLQGHSYGAFYLRR